MWPQRWEEGSSVEQEPERQSGLDGAEGIWEVFPLSKTKHSEEPERRVGEMGRIFKCAEHEEQK